MRRRAQRPGAAVPPPDDVLVIGGKTLITREHAARLLGVKTTTLSTVLWRGELALTRYVRGRVPSFDLAEVEAVILSKAIPAGRRVRP